MPYPPRACPVCRSEEKTSLYRQQFAEVAGQLQLDGYNVGLCGECGAAYADDIPDQRWFDAYYQAVSKYTHDQSGGEEPEEDTRRFRDIAAHIAPYLPDPGSRIVDFGCASAGLLRQLKDKGYPNVLGVDPSPASAEVARSRHGIRVVTTGLQEVTEEYGTFDLLIQVGVLEHIRDVDTALLAIKQALRPGALTYVEVPDVTGFADCYSAPFQQFSVEHINFFSRSSLIRLMGRMGFEPVEVLRGARAHSADAQMPIVYGMFRVGASLGGGRYERDAETEPALRRYIKQSSEAEAGVGNVIDGLVASQEPLLVWGVGTHTLHLMETTAFRRLNVLAFVDSNPSYQDRMLAGRHVITPSQVAQYPQRILISSQVFQSEIDDQIRNRLRLPNDTIFLYPTA